jgi:hypothetical protein
LQDGIHRGETSSEHVRRGQAKLDETFMNSEISALQLRGLAKRFERLAVDALDLTVQPASSMPWSAPTAPAQTAAQLQVLRRPERLAP